MSEQPDQNPEYRPEPYPTENFQHGRDHGDRTHNLVWALILIWAGLVFMVENIGLLNRLALPSGWIPGSREIAFAHPSAWTLILLGAGAIILIEAITRSLVAGYAKPDNGRYILAVVLIGIGLANLFGSAITWPLVIIGIGVIILLSAVLRK